MNLLHNGGYKSDVVKTIRNVIETISGCTVLQTLDIILKKNEKEQLLKKSSEEKYSNLFQQIQIKFNDLNNKKENKTIKRSLTDVLIKSNIKCSELIDKKFKINYQYYNSIKNKTYEKKIKEIEKKKESIKKNDLKIISEFLDQDTISRISEKFESKITCGPKKILYNNFSEFFKKKRISNSTGNFIFKNILK